jgi:hypothetical protein
MCCLNFKEFVVDAIPHEPWNLSNNSRNIDNSDYDEYKKQSCIMYEGWTHSWYDDDMGRFVGIFYCPFCGVKLDS